MNIYEVANRLEECAQARSCAECPYRYNKFGEARAYADCQADLIKEMGAECEKIVEGLNKVELHREEDIRQAVKLEAMDIIREGEPTAIGRDVTIRRLRDWANE